MPKILNVLYGFKSEVIEKSLTREFVLRGYNVKSNMRTTKELIKDFVKNHPELDVVILKEFLDGGGMYSPRELAELVDECFVNIVIVIGTLHRGKPEMRDYYASGILNAYFSDGKFGANPDKLADLAVNGRNRRQAREYYKIEEVVPDHINLTYEQYRDNYKFLIDNSMGASIIDRFVTISNMLYSGQLGAFIDDLPDRVKEMLMQYREFYDIANKVYRQGYSRQKYKMPVSVKQGLTKEVMLDALDRELNGGTADKGVELKPVQTMLKEESENDEDVAEEGASSEKEAAEPSEKKPEIKKERIRKDTKKKKRGLFGRKKAVKEEPQSLFDEVDDGLGQEEEDAEYDGLKEMRQAGGMQYNATLPDVEDVMTDGEANTEVESVTNDEYDSDITPEESLEGNLEEVEEVPDKVAGVIEDIVDVESGMEQENISDEQEPAAPYADIDEGKVIDTVQEENQIDESEDVKGAVADEDADVDFEAAETVSSQATSDEEIDYSKYSVEELMNMLGN